MATAASEAELSTKKIKLMGPAKTEFDTFMDQCIYFADLYWPDWNNYENPSSYIIPPVFTYKHMDVSDEIVQIVQEREALRRSENASHTTSRDHILNHRISDMAEHIVYSAMQQLIEDKVQAPIFVVHNLNIDKNHKLISQLFPNLDDDESLKKAFERCKREYDFLIIGPRVGIVAIEVKSSQYTGSRHFVETNNHLPEDYNKGLQQLESVDALFSTLAACAKLDSLNSGLALRKVLFTPNLTRERYETWKNSIGPEACRNVESRTSDVHQWYTEDMDNCTEHSAVPPLYSKLRDILESDTTGLTRAISEKYALLVSGLRSMIYFGGDLQLNKLHFSQNKAILSEHQRIIMQNPFDGGKTTKLSKHSPLKLVDRSILSCESKLLFLSPDQQAVLEGPSRQFIIGVAGTGKTVVLQAKALQLLSEGEAVVVFSPKCYIQQYEKLFDSYGFTNYQCLPWPHEGFEHFYAHFDNSAHQVPQLYTVDEVLTHICEYVNEESSSKTLKWLLHKSIVIDDTCDQFPNPSTSGFIFSCLYSFNVAWCIMEYIGSVCPTKTVWTASDPSQFSSGVSHVSSVMNGLLRNNLGQGGAERFRVCVLRQVMRCSESVFRSAYAAEETEESHKLRWVGGTEPILAHKIQGLKMEAASEFFDFTTAEDAMLRLHVKIQETLGRLSKEGVDMANVAVVFGMLPHHMDYRHQMDHRHQDAFTNASILYFRYDEVSSMEWPIVIYASCFENKLLGDNYWHHAHLCYSLFVTYPRYRAATRATTRLIDITVTYRDPETKFPTISVNAGPTRQPLQCAFMCFDMQ